MEMNPDCSVQDQLNTSESTAPYIIGREFNLRKLPGRQWESNPQPGVEVGICDIKAMLYALHSTISNSFLIHDKNSK